MAAKGVGRLRAFAVALVAVSVGVAFVVPATADANRCAGKRVSKDFRGEATSGDEVFIGTSRNDVIVGGNGEDKMDGRGGRDRLCGGRDDDTLNGDGGRDVLIGNRGDDALRGESGRDILAGGAGEDSCHGGDGFDVQKGCESGRGSSRGGNRRR